MSRLLVWITLGTIGFSCVTQTLWAQTEKWIVDTAHSKIGFEIGHLIISTVDGRFTDYEGTVEFDTQQPQKSVSEFKTQVTIKAASIDTGNAKRDEHLRSPDFFDTAKNPTLSFTSKKVPTDNGQDFSLHGALTIAGVTKPVTFQVSYLGNAKLYDVQRIAFQATTTIKREDFGLTWNSGDVKASTVAGKIAEATGAVGSEVTIELSIQAKRAKDLK